MDYVQALFSFFIAPLLGAILVGMFWKRATKRRRILGLARGYGHFDQPVGWVKARSIGALRYRCVSADAKDMAENMYRALWSFITAVVVTRCGQPVHQAEAGCGVDGLVYGATTLPDEEPVPLYKNEYFWAADRHRRVRSSQHYFLVSEQIKYAFIGHISIWFFIGRAAYRLRRDDFRLRPLRAGNASAGKCGVGQPARPVWWGAILFCARFYCYA